jgi:hypothetical protein
MYKEYIAIPKFMGNTSLHDGQPLNFMHESALAKLY